MTPHDEQRLFELLRRGRRAGRSPEDVAQRITIKMPHIAPADIKRVLTRRGEAIGQIGKIAIETEKMTERTPLTIGESVEMLRARAEQGDKRSIELLGQITNAMLKLAVM